MVARRRVQGWEARHAPRQDGRRFVVTGASAGLGLALTRMLVDLGAEVTIAVRGRRSAATIARQGSVRLPPPPRSVGNATVL